ncbi:hypothetical protein EBZ37_07425 [bacterium]|nr:hypothetical protein [bacterium]
MTRFAAVKGYGFPLLLFFYGAAALAEPPQEDQCEVHDASRRKIESQVNNDKGMLGPVRDQDSLGYCYAYAAADLVEHWLKKNKKMPPGESVSAMAMGLRDQSASLESPQVQAQIRVAHDARLTFQPKIQNLDEKQIPQAKQEANQPLVILNGRVSEQNVEAAKKLSTLRYERREYKKLSSPSVPEGGDVGLAIRRSWPESGSGEKICFESEVSSRDNGLLQTLGGNDPLLGKKIDLYEALGLISERSLSSSVEDRCQFIRVAQEIFPSASRDQLVEVLFRLQAESSVVKNPFSPLLEKACKAKTGLDVAPKIEAMMIPPWTPPLEENNADILKLVDAGLSQGGVVAISYRASILKYARPQLIDREEDQHASVIIGSAKVCGKDYYILRNSWGKLACQGSRNRFTQKNVWGGESEETTRAIELLKQEEGRCRESNDPTCYTKVWARRAKVVDVPYFCDGDGNYVIRKDYLARGIYGATRITN